jgi:hypothetical protein
MIHLLEESIMGSSAFRDTNFFPFELFGIALVDFECLGDCPAEAATTTGGTPWLTEIWTSPEAMAADIAVPVSNATHVILVPSSFS